MKRLLLLTGVAAALVAAPGIAAGSGGDRKIVGPAVLCGSAFALRLKPGESVLRPDPGVDFLLYDVAAADGSFLVYEGNAPQPHDEEIQTGLSFPSVIAIHDNRSVAAKRRSRIRDRLITGAARTPLCQGSRSG